LSSFSAGLFLQALRAKKNPIKGRQRFLIFILSIWKNELFSDGYTFKEGAGTILHHEPAWQCRDVRCDSSF
jgi:hypothetical protein